MFLFCSRQAHSVRGGGNQRSTAMSSKSNLNSPWHEKRRYLHQSSPMMLGNMRANGGHRLAVSCPNLRQGEVTRRDAAIYAEREPHFIIANPMPPSALMTTASRGGARQTVSSTKLTSAIPKSPGTFTALVHTGL